MAVEVRYNGPQPSRDISVGEGRRVRIEQGRTAKVPERVAESLCEQRYFTRVERRPRRAESTRRPIKGPQTTSASAEKKED